MPELRNVSPDEDSRPESRMREIRTSGSEGGEPGLTRLSYPYQGTSQTLHPSLTTTQWSKYKMNTTCGVRLSGTEVSSLIARPMGAKAQRREACPE